MCPVKSFMKYKKNLNVKCNRLFQRPSKGTIQWYDNCPLGHNTIGSMMPNISVSAGLSKRYTNHSLRATSVHILDKEQFASRHIMSVTGHKSENSLKTYTGYTDQNIKKRMSDTISESLNPLTTKKVCARSGGNLSNERQDENLNLASGVLEPVSNAEFNTIVQDIASSDGEFDRLLTTIDTNNMVIPGSSNTLNYANNHMTKQSMMNVPIPVFKNCSNITINYNFNK